MNGLAIVFLVLASLTLMALPRQWAFTPLLAGSLFITNAQGFELFGANFTLVRFLIVAGVIRVVARGEKPVGMPNLLDGLMIVWALWAVTSSLGHESPFGAFVFRSGLVLDYLGIYFLCRCFCTSMEDVVRLTKIVAFLLLPVALEMILEKVSGHNLFSYFGGVPENPAVREGRIRAQGPFKHSILAGTVGAACFPLMIGLWRRERKAALIGLFACICMVLACASSGPLLSAAAGVFAIALFTIRKLMWLVKAGAAALYFMAGLAMGEPGYYVMSRIDVAGGSTGWHRARLIESAFEHLEEWWFMGTDFTRHWMPTGVSWSPDHTDITNYYIKMGVWGGLPLMLVFIAIVLTAFRCVRRAIDHQDAESGRDEFLLWCLGSSLFAMAVSGVSVNFFDQSYVFFYVFIGFLSSLAVRESSGVESSAEDEDEDIYGNVERHSFG